MSTTDLALIASNPSAIEAAADPGQFVIQACERAKTWLAEALEHGDIEQIVELKSQAEAIRVYTMSKQLGEDARLSATEIVRRAERGIGLAIRKGQAEGRISKKGDQRSDQVRTANLMSPKSFVTSGQELHEAYVMTDDVTDEQFDAVLADAKTEGNLSRANVVRRVREATPAASTPAAQVVKPGRKRRPITDTARETGWAIRKEVEKVERLLTDDRFAPNKDQVAAHLHGHLTYAVEALQRALDHFTREGE